MMTAEDIVKSFEIRRCEILKMKGGKQDDATKGRLVSHDSDYVDKCYGIMSCDEVSYTRYDCTGIVSHGIFQTEKNIRGFLSEEDARTAIGLYILNMSSPFDDMKEKIMSCSISRGKYADMHVYVRSIWPLADEPDDSEVVSHIDYSGSYQFRFRSFLPRRHGSYAAIPYDAYGNRLPPAITEYATSWYHPMFGMAWHEAMEDLVGIYGNAVSIEHHADFSGVVVAFADGRKAFVDDDGSVDWIEGEPDP